MHCSVNIKVVFGKAMVVAIESVPVDISKAVDCLVH